MTELGSLEPNLRSNSYRSLPGDQESLVLNWILLHHYVTLLIQPGTDSQFVPLSSLCGGGGGGGINLFYFNRVIGASLREPHTSESPTQVSSHGPCPKKLPKNPEDTAK